MRLVTIIGLFRCAFKGAGLGFKDVVRTSRAWELFLLRALFRVDLGTADRSLLGASQFESLVHLQLSRRKTQPKTNPTHTGWPFKHMPHIEESRERCDWGNAGGVFDTQT